MSATTAPVAPAPVADPRRAAYCAYEGPDVFGTVVHGNQIWTPDPFDVETIHADARAAFDRLVGRAAVANSSGAGKSLLLLGDAGSGKTHLLRAFRNGVHADESGYCGYVQLNTRTDNYARYILGKLIDSLDQPYSAALPRTGLQRLARGLVDALEVIPGPDRQTLVNDFLDPADLAKLVHRLAYAAVQYEKFARIDINVIRALLFTVADDARVHAAALQWLRCEDLARADRELLGDLVPRPQAEMPAKTIQSLGQLMHAVHSAALVLLADQFDELILDKSAPDRGVLFRDAMDAVVTVADGLPNAVVVVACLKDSFDDGKQYLPMPKLDRIERDPEPIRLVNTRTPDQIAALAARRLEGLYEAAGVEADDANPVAPFELADFAALAPLRQRDILNQFRLHRQACVFKGEWFKPGWEGVAPPAPPPPLLAQAWNDFLTAFKPGVLDDETALAKTLAAAVRLLSTEVPDGVHFGADPDKRFVSVEVNMGDTAADQLLIAVCDKSTRGGGLTNQIKEVALKTGDIPAVLVRSTAFPTTAGSVVVKDIAKLIAPVGKGRRVVVSNSDWRAMAAFEQFHAQHHAAAGFADWQRDDKPLSGLPALAAILALDKLPAAAPPKPAPVVPPPPPKSMPKVARPTLPFDAPTPDAEVRLGDTRGAAPQPVSFARDEFKRHAAFLGGSGSGKTTAALAVVEQLLLAGVPAILLDRKGDLARYADPKAWAEPLADPALGARREQLRARVEVALYTPGGAAGRPLAIPVAPDFAELPAADRDSLARQAAASLGSMMGFRGATAGPKLVILQEAIKLQAGLGRAVSVAALRQLVADQDDSLLVELGGYDAKHFKKLAEELLTFGHQYKHLLEGAESLDFDALLGRDDPNKVRLSVINTQSLGDETTTDFWVAQFLICLGRWTQARPSGRLQAVVLFDEADKYLPAVGKPATKAPLERLLKASRSAGVGLFLSTQSPGDLDYKGRDQVLTWLLGRVKEPTALAKLRPMLESRPDALDKLAGQSAGEFYLVRETSVQPVRAGRNVIETTQLSTGEILALAARNAAGRRANLD